jgi:hypothetical protein
MKKRRIQPISLLIGSLLAVVIVCSQFFHYEAQGLSKEVKTEQQESGQTGNDAFSLPSFSLPSPVHVQLSLDFHCLLEILFEDQEEEVVSTDTPSFPQKLLITLFSVIISPNAP